MKKKEQATRTRTNLVLAAARNFDRHGYDGTSLAAVCGDAGISMGALTFHFRSKAALAAAVADEGVGELQRIRTARPRTGRPLHDLSCLVLAVAATLHRSVHARSAARLIAEGHVVSDWPADWRGEVEELIECAWKSGALTEEVQPGTATRLVRHLVDGVTAEARVTGGQPGPTPPDFAEVWRAALTGLAADPRNSAAGLP
ncbi:TetR/AcrR family transcriptional regulator [Streptomyces sp. CoH27]|uniref:TetR/AcrR family transcriptional regulator n=1 Tax=Streptomyces sp. CoH27 TaxID=2875763 RepID=UPI001CD799E0|nr:TetR/AcrR family transcriptional regulator [Streptomyces sp. CoH27]